MNNRLIPPFLFISSALLLTGCSEDNSSFESLNDSGSPSHSARISQNNFNLLFSDGRPEYFNVQNNTISAKTVDVSVEIGDINNQLITQGKTIHFKTEWGLIDPSCTTKDGRCTVKWRSGSSDDMPINFRSNILAYSTEGQESFADLNDNGLFDDSEILEDIEEPYLDVDESGAFSAGDEVIDTINGLDLTGADNAHNGADGLFNGPNCSHSTLCSPTLTTSAVWENASIRLTGSTTSSIGGTVIGLTGDLVLQNNGGDTLKITADGTFTFSTPSLPGYTYNVTIVPPLPATVTCTTLLPGTTINTGFGIVVGNITSVTITCS